MLFSSPVFIYLFLPTVLLIYYTILKKFRTAQNIFLCIVSLLFYAWGEPKFVLVMIGSIILNWIFGLLVDKYRCHAQASKALIAANVILNLGLLFVFKYLNFAGDILHATLGIALPVSEIALPIGISFFTFQAMSYVIDVYRQKGDVQKDILCVGLYISFFPQLIAGPIVRYETIADQIHHRKETFADVTAGFSRFIVGLAKKVLLSNSLALLADTAFGNSADQTLSVAFSWLGAIAYTLQIFFDFSGYSDMAIGLGRMFGFHFLENFDYPYISTSVSEFWRRWHMSLGTWFRDYVYFPLGGSRVRKPRLVFNLFVVWSLTGLWHGADFTFILWGLMYFVLITVEKLTGFDKHACRIPRVLRWAYSMLFVILGWVFFRSESVSCALDYIGAMFGMNGNAIIDGMFTGYLAQNLILIVIAVVLCTPIMRVLKQKIKANMFTDTVTVVVLLALFILSVSSLVSNSYNPFIYFNF